MKRVEVVNIETLERDVHYEGHNGNDFTLCGDTLDECAEDPVITTKRVSCETCKAIVAYVRGSKAKL
jgi:hypothetical protein